MLGDIVREHIHRCRECDLAFCCRCEDEGNIMGTCATCDSERMPLVAVLLFLAAGLVWVLIIKGLMR
jgi:hypothetical protein